MKRLLLLLIAAALCTTVVRAETAEDKLDPSQLKRALPTQAHDLLTEDCDSESFLNRSASVLRRGILEAGNTLPAAIRSVLRIILITAVCVTLQSFGTAHTGAAVSLAGAAGITVCFAKDLNTMLLLGQQTVTELSEFSKLLIPMMASATALSGAISASAAISSLTTVLMQIFIQLIETLILPLSGVYVALCTAASGLGQESLDGLSSAVGSVMKHGIRGILFLFTAYLSVTGLLTESTDAAAIRAAKLTVTTAVPVAGNVLSEASSSVLAGAKLLQASIGAFGMLGVLAIVIVPFLRLGIHYLLLNFAGFCCAALGGTQQKKLVSGLSSAMGILLAATAGCSLMVFVSCVCLIRVHVL